MNRDDDLRELMDDEKGRGRRQPHAKAVHRRMQKIAKAWPELLDIRDENVLRVFLSEFGFEEGTSEYERVLMLWRARWKP